MKNCQFNSSVMVRSPYYSFIDYSIARLPKLLADPLFQRALYLASPELFTLLESKKFNASALNDKQQLTLLKYINRMHYRPTPFGGFSSFSAAQWNADATMLMLDHLSAAKLQLNWDQEVVLKLTEPIFHNSFKDAELQLNPTLYRVMNEYRFITTDIDFTLKKLLFNLEAIDQDELLDLIIDFLKKKTSLPPLIQHIAEFTEWSATDAEDYIRALFELQFIKADNYPNIAGDDYLTKLCRQYPSLPQTIIKQLPSNNTDNSPEKVQAFAAQMNHHFAANDIAPPKHFFYANTSRPIKEGDVPLHYQQKIKSALEAIYRALPANQPVQLQKFTDEFKKRYDLREVSLLQALDPETGIGYAGLAARFADDELLTDLAFKTPESAASVQWTDLHKLLFRRWVSPLSSPEGIVLTFDDLNTGNQEPNPLPPSFTVFFRGLGRQLFLESAGGVTATAIMGRFTYLSNEFLNTAKNILKQEQEANPGVVFADIAQVSGIHADNINRRASLYAHEIVINAGSNVSEQNQLPVADLLISCRNGQIVLRSKKLNKQIIPRLASAYNYIHHDLAAFRFLCDLQYQGVQSSLSFDPEQFFPGLNEYPRITLGDVIISAAKWYLKEADIKSSKDIDQLIREKNLPRYVALAQGDQQLVFDLQCHDQKLFLLNCVRGTKNIQLQEYLMPENFPVTEAGGKPMISQFVSFINNNDEIYKPHLFEDTNYGNTERAYALGSPWVYLKIYCHEQAANHLLAGSLQKALSEIDGEQLDTWFFIRYHDPLPHIRLRLKLKNGAIGQVISRLRQSFERNGNAELIQDYQAHVYHRELERYNPLLIEHIEDIFNKSSALICKYIQNTEFIETASQTYKLAFISLNEMLHLFLDSAGQRIEFTAQVWQSLFAEFNGDKPLKVSLDQKYRSLKAGLDPLPNDTDFYTRLKLKAEHEQFMSSLCTLKIKMQGFNNGKKLQILADIVHMHFNRIFITEQRKQELAVYYMMHKHLLSRKAIGQLELV
jgi:thiopeptide-type bacteriocin biosynthesis protein